MKKISKIISALLYVLVLAAPLQSAGKKNTFANDFVGVENGRFVLRGKPFRFVGANSYYLRYHKNKAQVLQVLDSAQAMGLKVMRIQANGEYPQDVSLLKTFEQKHRWFLSGAADNFYEPTFKRYDWIMDECRKRGLRVIIYVQDNWAYFGGIETFAGYFKKHKLEFFTDPSIKAAYKGVLKKWLTRRNTVNGRLYREDPTVFAWELINEPRYEKDTSGKTLAAWIAEMSSYIKSIDPHHLVSAGIEGFINKKGSHYSGADYTLCTAPASIDFGTMHFYPWDKWRQYDLVTVKRMIRQVIEASKRLGKPAVLEEFGVEQELDDKGQVDRYAYTTAMANDFLAAGGQGVMFWQLSHEGYGDGKKHDISTGNSRYVEFFTRLAKTLKK